MNQAKLFIHILQLSNLGIFVIDVKDMNISIFNLMCQCHLLNVTSVVVILATI